MKKAVLITGGARRVGAAMALYFAKHGYDIALHYNRSKADAVRVKKDIEKLGRSCVVFSQDLIRTKELPAFMAKVKKAMPHCAALVNNASIFERNEFMDTNEALFDRQFAVNFKAPFFLTQTFAKTFKQGSVINMLDTDISTAQGMHFAYLLSKKTLAEFTAMAARALGPKIRVNGICPGYVLANSAADAAYIKRVTKELPLKEHATLEAIAEAVLWLSTQRHITGQILFVDGGKHVL